MEISRNETSPRWGNGNDNPNCFRSCVKYLVISAIALFLGLFLLPYLIRQQVSKKIVLSPELNPDLFQAWLRPPVPIYFSVYLFNVTNPSEIEAGLPPNFTEIGPYVFQEIRQKVNVSLNDTEDTVTFQENIKFHFLQDKSGHCSLQDVVTLINLPFVTAAIKIDTKIPWPLNHIPQMILQNYQEPLFLTKTVEQTLFKGWTVPFLEQIERELGFSVLANNTFSFFMGQNDSYNGPYTIRRGLQGNKQEFGQVVNFQGQTSLKFWGKRDSHCNRIQGTDGFFFKPFLEKNSFLYMFGAELCRSVYVSFKEIVKFRNISAYRFTIAEDALEHPSVNPENDCFCDKFYFRPDSCVGKGIIDLRPCQDGAPVGLSAPHFLDVDPKYLRKIGSGLKPEREKHEAVLDIEPLTGTVIRAKKRLQTNLILKRIEGILSLKNLKDGMMFPMIWVEEGAEINEELANVLATGLFYVKMATQVSKWGAFGITAICVILAIKQIFSTVVLKNIMLRSRTIEHIDANESFLEHN